MSTVLLHDIGKIGIEQSILSKQISEMTMAELTRYQNHTLLGETALLMFEPLKEASMVIKSHHERFDGKGFPGKLSGDQIPLGARIVALANDFDNLQLPNNFYGKALSVGQAHEFIVNESGKRYDPDVVRIFDQEIDQVHRLLSKNREVLVELDKAKPGMRLSQDLSNQHGMVMLAVGKILTEGHIEKLKQFELAFETRLSLWIRLPTKAG